MLYILLLFSALSETKAVVIFVDSAASGANTGTSWTDAYNDLQLAFQTATPGDDIWVAIGTYYPTSSNDRDRTFDLKNGIDLFGGFVGNESSPAMRAPGLRSILSGNIGDPNVHSDNSKHIAWVSDTLVYMQMDAFELVDGYSSASSGAAVYTHKCFLTFVNCIFRNNFSWYGGAICSTNSSMDYIDCRFEDNSGIWGGAYQCWGGTDDQFYNCVFVRNISSFTAGAISAQFNSDLTLDNCRFYENVAKKGGAIYIEQGGRVHCMNNIYDGNQADSGAAVFVTDNGRFTCHNSAIVQNYASVEGGGLFLESGEIRLRHSILRDNYATGNTGNMAGDSNMVFRDYCLLQKPSPGMGNLVADPQFADRDGPDNVPGNEDDDLHLLASSPGNDAGIASFLPPDWYDRNGNLNMLEPFPFDLDEDARVQDGALDIGPYEGGVKTSQNVGLVNDLRLGLPYPNPSRRCELMVDLRAGMLVTVSLWDVSERMVRKLYEGWLPGGENLLELLAPAAVRGLCFLEVSVGEEKAVRRWWVEEK